MIPIRILPLPNLNCTFFGLPISLSQCQCLDLNPRAYDYELSVLPLSYHYWPIYCVNFKVVISQFRISVSYSNWSWFKNSQHSLSHLNTFSTLACSETFWYSACYPRKKFQRIQWNIQRRIFHFFSKRIWRFLTLEIQIRLLL